MRTQAEEVDVVSTTTPSASSPEVTLEHTRDVVLPEQRRGRLRRASRRRWRSSSASAPALSSPTPPPPRLGAPAHASREHANEDARWMAISVSSVTAVESGSGSSHVLDGMRVSAPLVTAAAHSSYRDAGGDDKERRSEQTPELSWNPHAGARPVCSPTRHGSSAKWKLCLGHRPWSATHRRPPPASPQQSSQRMCPSGAHSYTYDIPPTLAELFCRYLSRAPPLSLAAAAAGDPPPEDGAACTRFLLARWGCPEMRALPSQSGLHPQPTANECSWSASSSPSSCPPPPPPPLRAVSSPSPPRLSATHVMGKRNVGREQCGSSSHCSATSREVPHALQQSRQEEHLWNLLTHYPRDASACLALGLSVCAVLGAMQAAPPPVLPLAVLQGIAATTATDVRCFISACEEAWQTAAKPSPEPTAAPAPLARGAEDSTCRCGCVTTGQLLDPALYRFHLLYYRHHHRYAPLRRGDGESAMNDASHNGERNELDEGRAALFGLPCGQRQPPRHPPYAPLPPHFACVQGTPPTVLLPLLAVQTLSTFVGVSNARRSSAISRQRQRWELRETRRRCRHSSTVPPDSTATATEPLPADAAALDRQAIARPAVKPPSPSGEGKDGEGEAGAVVHNYAHFCDETERLWAVMASVFLAWKQLEQCVSLAVLVPQLEVLPCSAWRTRQLAPQAPSSHGTRSSALSPLERAAASMRLHRSTVEGMLLHATVERAALARLRVRLLSVPPRPGNTAKANLSDGVTSSLLMMESFVYAELQGRMAHLPLWCAVAVEVLQLFVEQSRQDRAWLERMAREEKVDAATPRAAGLHEEAAWCVVHSSRVQQVVLLATRIMALPCVFANSASIPSFPGDRAASPPPPYRPRRWHRTSLENHPTRVVHGWGGSQYAPHDDPVAAPTAASPAREKVPAPVSATTLTQLSAVMSRHPLFGVAVAVVGGGVPLHWAQACVAPRAMNVHSLAIVQLLPPSAQMSNRRGNRADTWLTSAAGMAAADAEAQTELRRLVELLHKWLREAERRA
ncbi:hypothetical protein, conserved [Leishmania tarentolae]|uniref:Uncharacterized protein n=1 Tax=Leishmania tarentolae TaxID=5689 RepID=A0A640KD58_LEITA|nr:hypothetical protein, conserved [Leishmania tarentolae]